MLNSTHRRTVGVVVGVLVAIAMGLVWPFAFALYVTSFCIAGFVVFAAAVYDWVQRADWDLDHEREVQDESAARHRRNFGTNP